MPTINRPQPGTLAWDAMHLGAPGIEHGPASLPGPDAVTELPPASLPAPRGTTDLPSPARLLTESFERTNRFAANPAESVMSAWSAMHRGTAAYNLAFAHTLMTSGNPFMAHVAGVGSAVMATTIIL
jgi:hypothetical protein